MARLLPPIAALALVIWGATLLERPPVDLGDQPRARILLAVDPIYGLPSDPAKYEEAIAAWRRGDPMPKAQWEKLEDEEREYAFTIAGVAQASIISDAWESIDRAIENGRPFADVKAEMTESLERSWGGEKPGRIETIFRTNVNGAYNAGRHAIFTAPAVKEARPYWRFDLIDDADLCEICQDCKGVILAADDPWWEEHLPPLHFRCRCSFAALSKEEAEDEGIDADGPDVDVDEGFGAPPAEQGDDWADPGDYPREIGDVLAGVLDRGI